VTQARPALSRRGLMAGVLGGLAASASLAGCQGSDETPAASVQHSAYGADPSQWGELYLPGRTPLATVVVVHGGWWADGFGAQAMRPMCQALQKDGYAVWNLEYRRINGGGGWPMTFEDVAAGIDHLDTFDSLDTSDVRLVGHSAGGQLAVWAASRRDTSPGEPSAVQVSRCLSLAGVLDLTTASHLGFGLGNVDRLMGGTPEQVPDHYAEGDPTLMVPASCPVACVHDPNDPVVPIAQSQAYVAAAQAVGAPVSLDLVDGGHAGVIDPAGLAWPTVTRLLAGGSTPSPS
jgi:acetyl esterase/lipase